jgi:muramoyltetrapeptide carboxypeptidase
MIRPKSLIKDSKIAIISPAGAVDKKFVSAANDYFLKAGFSPEIFPFAKGQFNKYSGTDNARLKDLQTAFDREDISAILCARGGYGCIRIIDKLDFRKFIKSPKWLIGFSDITILHSAINSHGILSIHGPMAKAFFEEPESDSVTQLINILKGKVPEYQLKPHPQNRVGKAEATLTGGNLSTIYSLQGTKYEINTKDKILFIEDLCEQLYHLDRMMNNLKLSGKLAELKGLIVGRFTEMQDGEITFGKTVNEIILEHTADYDYPVCFDFPAGHISNNMPIVNGMNYNLEVADNQRIVVVK